MTQHNILVRSFVCLFVIFVKLTWNNTCRMIIVTMDNNKLTTSTTNLLLVNVVAIAIAASGHYHNNNKYHQTASQQTDKMNEDDGWMARLTTKNKRKSSGQLRSNPFNYRSNLAARLLRKNCVGLQQLST